MGLVAWALWRARDRVPARGPVRLLPRARRAERFLVEFLRRNDEVALGLTAPQLESLAMMVAGLVWLALAARRGGCASDERLRANSLKLSARRAEG